MRFLFPVSASSSKVFTQGQGNSCTYTWPDGSMYMGQWEANAINGRGHYMGRDGREFQGMWRGAVIHGCGRYSWPDGRTFKGNYFEDQKHGFGTFTWQDGRRFDGFWAQGKQHGHGITYKADGTILKEGVWKRGQFAPDAPSPATAAPAKAEA
ncbi:PIP5K8 [Symbiodinium natans]|uniref:PIP5K8 protein n=1 Tax=Symbiodinium natans TaxID=878477 RepID=A0A812MCN6_9DINO|nr:PIP5K8 [Symbiodinium natans]